MAKVPKANRAPGALGQIVRAARMQRIFVAVLINLACWAAVKFVLAPAGGPWWAMLILAAVMVLQCARAYVEIRDGMRHATELSALARELGQLEVLVRDAHARGDDEAFQQCEGRGRYLMARSDFHRLGLRGELPEDTEV